MALTATLGFEGVMEIELSDFVVEVVVIEDPQPVTDIKAIVRAIKESLTRQRNEFILTL